MAACPDPTWDIDVFAMQKLQRHPDLGQLMVDWHPVRLGENALVVAATREQQGVHLVLGLLPHLIPTDALAAPPPRERSEASPRGPERVEIARPESPSARAETSFALIFRTIEPVPSTMWPSHGGRSLFGGSQERYGWPPRTIFPFFRSGPQTAILLAPKKSNIHALRFSSLDPTIRPPELFLAMERT